MFRLSPDSPDPSSPNYVNGKSVLPGNAAEVFHGNAAAGIKPAVEVTGRAPGTGQLYFGRSPDGQYYRYSGQNGEVHWSGAMPQNKVPNWIRKLL